MRAYLRRRGLTTSLAARLLAECQARGLLDDAASAKLWADHWARRGFAWAAIRVKLSAKGFNDHTIQSIANVMARASDDETRARRVVSQRVPGGTFDPQQRMRLARLLSARGFDPGVIQRVLGASFAPTLSD